MYETAKIIVTNTTPLKVENVNKKFRRSLKRSVLYGSEDISRDLLHLPSTSENLRNNEFWAVDDVSFGVKRGECLRMRPQRRKQKSTIVFSIFR